MLSRRERRASHVGDAECPKMTMAVLCETSLWTGRSSCQHVVTAAAAAGAGRGRGRGVAGLLVAARAMQVHQNAGFGGGETPWCSQSGAATGNKTIRGREHRLCTCTATLAGRHEECCSRQMRCSKTLRQGTHRRRVRAGKNRSEDSRMETGLRIHWTDDICKTNAHVCP